MYTTSAGRTNSGLSYRLMTQLPSDRSIQIWHPPPCPVPHCRGPNCNVTSLVIVLGCSPGHQELLSQVFQRHLQSLGEGAQSVSPHLQDNRTPRARHTETQLHNYTHTHTHTDLLQVRRQSYHISRTGYSALSVLPIFQASKSNGANA